MIATIRAIRKPLFLAAAVVLTVLALLALRSPAARATPTSQSRPSAYPGPSPYPGPSVPKPDAYEPDNSCAAARSIAQDAVQSHTLHEATDQDWLRFAAQAGVVYNVAITKVGAYANPVLALYDSCSGAPVAFAANPYGSQIILQWNSSQNGDYYLQVWPNDPALAGGDTDYTIVVHVDQAPPSPPTSLRCFAINSTTLGAQWSRSPETDVAGYAVNYQRVGGAEAGYVSVSGATTTYAEIGSLTAQVAYNLSVIAVDAAGNRSQSTAVVSCTPQEPADNTAPTFSGQDQRRTAEDTTSAPQMTFTGSVSDGGGNLSRVRISNLTNGASGWDYSLAGSSGAYRVADLPLVEGINQIQVTAFDEASNAAQRTFQVNRLGAQPGAAIIVAGRDNDYGLQLNIYNNANRAYRLFLDAGYSADNILYLAPAPQDADGNGTNDVNTAASPAAIESALNTWVRQNGRSGPGKPLFIYLIDHGKAEQLCINGCDSGQTVTPGQLNAWLDAMEQATGANQVTVMLEASRAGSFIDKNGDPAAGLGKPGRVIIAATGAGNNAYVSAQGAYFSDAFFTCAAASSDLKTCFDQGVSAVQRLGVNQTPWLDDDGDGVYTLADGAAARQRFIARYFTSPAPTIQSAAVTRQGRAALLEASIAEGREAIQAVWAALYPPGFQEPTGVAMDLHVPLVLLEPAPGKAGQYRYSNASGFPLGGTYRVVFYAQDRTGLHSMPATAYAGQVFAPLVRRP